MVFSSLSIFMFCCSTWSLSTVISLLVASFLRLRDLGLLGLASPKLTPPFSRTDPRCCIDFFVSAILLLETVVDRFRPRRLRIFCCSSVYSMLKVFVLNEPFLFGFFLGIWRVFVRPWSTDKGEIQFWVSSALLSLAFIYLLETLSELER